MYLDIQSKLEEKKMTRYELAKRIEVTYPTITMIYNKKSASIKLDILEKICIELDCTPNDIIIADNPKIKHLLEYHKRLIELSNNKNDAE